MYNNNYNKYIKYWKKINLIEGGGKKKKNIDIVDFIEKTPIETIKSKLLETMKNNIYCDKILGEGMMGEVYISGVNDIEEIEIGTKKITLPVVIKRAKDKGKFDRQQKHLFYHIQINYGMIKNPLIYH